MGFWDRIRGALGRSRGPTLGAVHEATLQVQTDLRRLGAALVRVDTQVRALGERVTAIGAETRDGLERLRRQQAEASAAARASDERARLLSPFLDLGDNFRRALQAAVVQGGADGRELDPAEALDALARLADHFERILRDAGLEALAAQGVPFDPRLHRAVGAMERPPEWEGRVVLVDRQGYRLDGAVLRPAEVWVAVGRAEQAVDGDRDVPWVDDPDEASDEQARGTP